MKKTFDCVEMKRRIQEQVYEETRDLDREEELAYFHKAAEQFWNEIRARRRRDNAHDVPTRRAGVARQRKRSD